MFGQISLDILLLFMLYATGATTAAIACLYLLLRRGNAFAPDVVSPVRLRRWTAAFFAALAMGHLWYMPAVVFTSSDVILLSMLVGGLLDCLLVIPLAIIILFCMLQDRQRPLWPVAVITAPLVVGMVVGIVSLSIRQPQSVNEEMVTTEEQAARDDIGLLLQQHCIDTQLYLQHDLTVTQLAQAIGTNRFYLGQYFSRQDTTYNAYINNLRINHFVSLYRETIAAQRAFTAQQLAHDSGYRSYSTFSLAFKQRMGQSVTAWMRHSAE